MIDKNGFQQDYISPYSEPYAEVQCPKYDPEALPEIQAMLEAHGASIEESSPGYIIRFPSGTTRHEVYPTVHCSRYMIVFPDGFKLKEQDHPSRRTSIVQFPPEIFSEKIQKKYWR